MIGCKALVMAAERGHVNMVTVLMSGGANVDHQVTVSNQNSELKP